MSRGSSGEVGSAETRLAPPGNGKPVRRADLMAGALGFSTAVADLWLFSRFGLDLARLLGTWSGWLVLLGFVLGYGALGFALGRLWMARVRIGADAEQIRRQVHELEQSRQAIVHQEKLAAMGRLAAGIAHEVRNPLGVIRSSAELVGDTFEETSDNHRACEFIVEEIDRLDGLIAALLAFSKPSRLTLAEVDLRDAVDRVQTLAEDIDTCRSLAFKVRLTSVPPIRADLDLLTQVLLGLTVNAAEGGAT
ncbi:MAG: histidine kinase dimerization/phospho-acceptor domain-containing protein, partial [Myxococcota bacterium]